MLNNLHFCINFIYVDLHDRTAMIHKKKKNTHICCMWRILILFMVQVKKNSRRSFIDLFSLCIKYFNYHQLQILKTLVYIIIIKFLLKFIFCTYFYVGEMKAFWEFSSFDNMTGFWCESAIFNVYVYFKKCTALLTQKSIIKTLNIFLFKIQSSHNFYARNN